MKPGVSALGTGLTWSQWGCTEAVEGARGSGATDAGASDDASVAKRADGRRSWPVAGDLAVAAHTRTAFGSVVETAR